MDRFGGGIVAHVGMGLLHERRALPCGHACSHVVLCGFEVGRAVLMYYCRYEKEFESVQDVFELQRNLNNAFAYDLVPSPSVIIAALKAARRVNDFPTAVRVFEGKSTFLGPFGHAVMAGLEGIASVIDH